MIVVDASVLVEALIAGSSAEAISGRLGSEPDQAAPHVIDVEVFSAIRLQHRHGLLERTEAAAAVADLEDWPGERFGHRLLLDRAWDLRDSVRGWDAMYVALAELLDAPLLTTDARLARAPGPVCEIEVLGGS